MEKGARFSSYLFICYIPLMRSGSLKSTSCGILLSQQFLNKLICHIINASMIHTPCAI